MFLGPSNSPLSTRKLTSLGGPILSDFDLPIVATDMIGFRMPNIGFNDVLTKTIEGGHYLMNQNPGSGARRTRKIRQP